MIDDAGDETEVMMDSKQEDGPKRRDEWGPASFLERNGTRIHMAMTPEPKLDNRVKTTNHCWTTSWRLAAFLGALPARPHFGSLRSVRDRMWDRF